MGGRLRSTPLVVAAVAISLVILALVSALRRLSCMLDVVAHELAHPAISAITPYCAKRKTMVASVSATVLSAAQIACTSDEDHSATAGCFYLRKALQ